MDSVVRLAAVDRGLIKDDEYRFPVIMRSGVNDNGKGINYIFNYSSDPVNVVYRKCDSRNLLTGDTVKHGDNITIQPWDVAIMCEK